MDGQRTAALDGVRGIAALAVLAFHLGLMPFGWMGVPVFFALSGYLITKGLIRRPPLGRFFAARARRLLPLLVVYLAVNGALAYATGSDMSGYGWFLVGLGNLHIAASNGAPGGGAVGHLWSLAVEMQFYLLWPLALLAFPRAWPVALAALLLGPLSREVMIQTTGNSYLALISLPGCLDALGAGALVAVVKDRRAHLAMMLTGTAILLATVPRISLGGIDNPPDWMPGGYLLLTGLALVSAVVVAYAHRMPGLATPALTWLGVRSYGFYVWHLLVVVALSKFAILCEGVELNRVTQRSKQPTSRHHPPNRAGDRHPSPAR